MARLKVGSGQIDLVDNITLEVNNSSNNIAEEYKNSVNASIEKYKKKLVSHKRKSAAGGPNKVTDYERLLKERKHEKTLISTGQQHLTNSSMIFFSAATTPYVPVYTTVNTDKHHPEHKNIEGIIDIIEAVITKACPPPEEEEDEEDEPTSSPHSGECKCPYCKSGPSEYKCAQTKCPIEQALSHGIYERGLERGVSEPAYDLNYLLHKLPRGTRENPVVYFITACRGVSVKNEDLAIRLRLRSDTQAKMMR